MSNLKNTRMPEENMKENQDAMYLTHMPAKIVVSREALHSFGFGKTAALDGTVEA